ncbi:hypothetical protein AVEN_255076-1 [Araneus ventricosus]|uniref:Reverse transcriptase/retrotransposon-derived protein RNase H-like domain-containing protein n=1 Tax=Araneus ventricosus TaxID=182803 RepID=A0A4Y2K1J0_ARAVE|nr:hypothetical protein AVEN_255076-1 [Araneus ventricosus]
MQEFISFAAHILAPLNKFLEDHRNKKKSYCPSKKTENSLQWIRKAKKSFNLAEKALVDSTLLKYTIPGAQISLWTDVAIRSSLMQLCNNKWEQIAVLSMKLRKSQRNLSLLSDRDLYAIYASIKKVRHIREGRNISI